jgi:hypothetical protein
MGQPAENLVGPVLATVGLIVAATALSWLSFRRQEL